jgi:hypothetical protein
MVRRGVAEHSSNASPFARIAQNYWKWHHQARRVLKICLLFSTRAASGDTSSVFHDKDTQGLFTLDHLGLPASTPETFKASADRQRRLSVSLCQLIPRRKCYVPLPPLRVLPERISELQADTAASGKKNIHGRKDLLRYSILRRAPTQPRAAKTRNMCKSRAQRH